MSDIAKALANELVPIIESEHSTGEKIEKLEADNAKLREALRHRANIIHVLRCPGLFDNCNNMCCKEARALLGEK